MCVGSFLIRIFCYSPDSSKSEEFKGLTKSLYEYGQKTIKAVDSSILTQARSPGFKPLSSLFVKGFDNEQIWQQMDVFNKPFLESLVLEMSHLSSCRALLTLNVQTKPPKSTEKNDSKGILKTTEEESLSPKKVKKEKRKKVKFAKLHESKDSELENDVANRDNVEQEKIDFFNLDEMEAFLDAEDRKEMNDQPDNSQKDDDIDYFADIPTDSDEDGDSADEESRKSFMYSSFFDVPKGKGLTTTIEESTEEGDDDEQFDGKGDEELPEESEDDDDLDTRDFDDSDLPMDDSEGHMMGAASDTDEEIGNGGADGFDSINEKLRNLANENLNPDDIDEHDKSEFEISQLKLRKRIDKAERELLHPANLHWQLAGETTGDVRPENSLLGEHLQFDHVSKPAPMITDQTTLTLESIIKQRIKDAAYDDVERKEKPNEKPFEFRRRIMLESEKSKVGLGEVYEQEYLKKQQQLKEQQEGNTSLFAAAGELEETETRKEIRRLMRGLFRKLDSLSAFHYTPRPPEPEVKILNNLPAISVEEVTPDTVSDMKLLAPEEVFSTRGKKVLQAVGERTTTDRKRARRLKKKKQSIKQDLSERRAKNRANSVNKGEIDKLKKGKKGSEASASGPFDKKSLTSSTKFFARLQESKETAKVVKRKKKASTEASQAKKLKL